jgi:hypothetical protein
MYIFLFVLSLLIIFLKIHIDDFTICLGHLNSLYILEKVQCDIKSESSYHATTYL